MRISVTATLCVCFAILVACRVNGVNWVRTAFATAIGGVTLYLSYGIALRFRLQHDLKLSPHDGQSGMDVLAFAILAALVATVFAVLVCLRITRPARPTNDR